MRISRNCYNSKFFHVMIQGIKKEKIFKQEYMKLMFIEFLKLAAQNNDVCIIAYCVMNNHAHILVYVEDISNLSKMMHSLNTKYAMKYNKLLERCGYVFRDRYRCENIHSIAYLKNCIKYVHNNPIKAGYCKLQSEYKYSSYREYIEGKIDTETINYIFGKTDDLVLELNKISSEDNCFIDCENEFGNSIDSPERVIESFYIEKNISKNSMSDIELRELITLLIRKCNISKVKICNLLEISRSKLYRTIKR